MAWLKRGMFEMRMLLYAARMKLMNLFGQQEEGILSKTTPVLHHNVDIVCCLKLGMNREKLENWRMASSIIFMT
jgi:hypothetical protein